MATEISNGLEARIKRRLGCSLSNFTGVPGCIISIAASRAPFSFDLFSVFVAVSNFKSERIVCDVPFDVNAKVDLDNPLFVEPFPHPGPQLG